MGGGGGDVLRGTSGIADYHNPPPPLPPVVHSAPTTKRSFSERTITLVTAIKAYAGNHLHFSHIYFNIELWKRRDDSQSSCCKIIVIRLE